MFFKCFCEIEMLILLDIGDDDRWEDEKSVVVLWEVNFGIDGLFVEIGFKKC